MINFTDEEDKVFRKVRMAYRQQDLCNSIKEQIEDTKKDIENYPKENDFKERLNLLKNLLDEIENITEYKDMQLYEEKTNCAYWDAEMLNNVIDDIIEKEKQASTQERTDY